MKYDLSLAIDEPEKYFDAKPAAEYLLIDGEPKHHNLGGWVYVRNDSAIVGRVRSVRVEERQSRPERIGSPPGDRGPGKVLVIDSETWDADFNYDLSEQSGCAGQGFRYLTTHEDNSIQHFYVGTDKPMGTLVKTDDQIEDLSTGTANVSAGFLTEDISKIEEIENLPDTEKQSLVKSRLGQGKFRKRVAKAWGGSEMCALSGVAINEVLIASHIVPWRESTGDREHERLDGCNGVLLCANIDKLFDSYKISFERVNNRGVLRYSSVLSKSDLESLGINLGFGLEPNAMNTEERERFFNYMQQHYQEFRKREGLE